MNLSVMESVLYAEDLTSIKDFYENVLGLETLEFDAGRNACFRCGNSVVIVFNPNKTVIPDAGVPTHGAHGPGHLAFRVDKYDLSEWRGKLVRSNIRIEDEVDWENGARSIYFRDPAGNSLEFVTPDLWEVD